MFVYLQCRSVGNWSHWNNAFQCPKIEQINILVFLTVFRFASFCFVCLCLVYFLFYIFLYFFIFFCFFFPLFSYVYLLFGFFLLVFLYFYVFFSLFLLVFFRLFFCFFVLFCSSIETTFEHTFLYMLILWEWGWHPGVSLPGLWRHIIRWLIN